MQQASSEKPGSVDGEHPAVTISITGTLQKGAWLDKTMPPIERVGPHVWSVPIGFAGNPVRYTLTYLLTNDAGECVVVDPGWDSPEGREQFARGLAAAGLTFDSIVGIVATHLHPDHLGMVRHVAEQTGAWIGMHPVEANALEHIATESGPSEGALLERWGVPDDLQKSIAVSPRALAYMSGLARPTVLLDDGDTLALAGRDVRVIATPGHTPGHICLADVDDRVVLTGDHVLPRITPNVGLGAADDNRNALRHYYESLDAMAPWDGFEVCPAHEYRFRGLAERANDLRAHHEQRAQEILDVLAVAPSLTVWQIAQRLTWSRGWDGLDGVNLRSALSETAAHLEHLAGGGELEWTGADVAIARA